MIERIREFDVYMGTLRDEEEIARGEAVHDLDRLNRECGEADWRKMKGWARASHAITGDTYDVEVHWYDAPGKGRVKLKIKRKKRIRQ